MVFTVFRVLSEKVRVQLWCLQNPFVHHFYQPSSIIIPYVTVHASFLIPSFSKCLLNLLLSFHFYYHCICLALVSLIENFTELWLLWQAQISTSVCMPCSQSPSKSWVKTCTAYKEVHAFYQYNSSLSQSGLSFSGFLFFVFIPSSVPFSHKVVLLINLHQTNPYYVSATLSVHFLLCGSTHSCSYADKKGLWSEQYGKD